MSSPTPVPWRQRKRVLVLQGGGALGSYQAGICEGIDAHGLSPNWVAGISIGAINAAIIAGNPPGRRAARLREFWEKTSSGLMTLQAPALALSRAWQNQLSAGLVTMFGVPGFFSPTWPGALWPPSAGMSPVSFYDTRPLRSTLEKLVDFDLINRGDVRLSVGAVDVETGNNAVFDNTQMRIGAEHVMASGALPPGLPPVLIDGRAYWDGGLVSNTPLQFILDQGVREDLLILQVDLFNARGPMPKTIADVDEREKDIRYSSRTRMNTETALRLHEIKGALRRLLDVVPDGIGSVEDLATLGEAARESAVAVIQLIYRKRPYEGGSKDYEFSRRTMLEHWNSGLADVNHCLAHADELLAGSGHGGVLVIDPGLHERPRPPSTDSRTDP